MPNHIVIDTAARKARWTRDGDWPTWRTSTRYAADNTENVGRIITGTRLEAYS